MPAVHKEGITVFEVDHPATRRVKNERLETIFETLPTHVTFVPLDFQQENLGLQLVNNGYDSRLKTLFIWEGAAMYLDPES